MNELSNSWLGNLVWKLHSWPTQHDQSNIFNLEHLFLRSISTIHTCETERTLCASHVVQDPLRPSHHVAPQSQNSVGNSNVAVEWLELQSLQPVVASTSLPGHIAHSCHWGIQQSRGAPLCGHLPNGRPYLGFAGCNSGFKQKHYETNVWDECQDSYQTTSAQFGLVTIYLILANPVKWIQTLLIFGAGPNNQWWLAQFSVADEALD